MIARIGATAGLIVLCVGSGVAPAPAHPGHGPPTVIVSSFSFAPQTLNVVAGDTVIWIWREAGGVGFNHSVTSDPGQRERFDSDPGESPDQVQHSSSDLFPYAFLNPGTFTYHCKVHPFMTGTVVVAAAPPAPVVDSIPPSITRLRAGAQAACRARTARCRVRVAVVRFALSEPADVKVTLRRERGRPVSRTVFASERKGRNTVAMPTRGLPTGPYRVTVVAIDAASNQSSPASTSLRLR